MNDKREVTFGHANKYFTNSKMAITGIIAVTILVLVLTLVTPPNFRTSNLAMNILMSIAMVIVFMAIIFATNTWEIILNADEVILKNRRKEIGRYPLSEYLFGSTITNNSVNFVPVGKEVKLKVYRKSDLIEVNSLMLGSCSSRKFETILSTIKSYQVEQSEFVMPEIALSLVDMSTSDSYLKLSISKDRIIMNDCDLSWDDVISIQMTPPAYNTGPALDKGRYMFIEYKGGSDQIYLGPYSGPKSIALDDYTEVYELLDNILLHTKKISVAKL